LFEDLFRAVESKAVCCACNRSSEQIDAFGSVDRTNGLENFYSSN
jgi:hypothetical protein